MILNATISPDGKKIAFLRDVDVTDETANFYIMNADGTGVNPITTSNKSVLDPAWFPDGTKISYTTSEAGVFAIYVMNIDGTDKTRLTDISSQNFQSAWSPGGEKIVFVSLRNGNRDNFTMNANGTEKKRLTQQEAYDRYPVWSPKN